MYGQRDELNSLVMAGLREGVSQFGKRENYAKNNQNGFKNNQRQLFGGK